MELQMRHNTQYVRSVVYFQKPSWSSISKWKPQHGRRNWKTFSDYWCEKVTTRLAAQYLYQASSFSPTSCDVAVNCPFRCMMRRDRAISAGSKRGHIGRLTASSSTTCYSILILDKIGQVQTSIIFVCLL